MKTVTKEHVLEALKGVRDIESKQDVITAGKVTGIVIRDGHVGFALEVTPALASQYETVRIACEQAVLALPGVVRVTAALTAEFKGQTSVSPSPAGGKPQTEKTPPAAVAGVKHIIVVASGKGGVGKSTVAVHLALSLAQSGLRVGLVDADIYGPSIPRMLGISATPEIRGQQMLPISKYGIQTMSIGYIVSETQAAVWRGPMATKTLHQLIRGTLWDDLDILLVDTPPGTGDIHLSLVENYPLSGVVIVSTPQEVALIDVRKAINMYEKTHTKILGVVQNMAYFLDPATGQCHYLYGQDGAKQLAEEKGLFFLGSVPFHMQVRETSDRGTPEPNSEAFSTVAKHLKEKIAL